MQLSYRGSRYNCEFTPVDLVETGQQGTYRGQGFPITYPRHIPVPQPVNNLMYRGVAYRTTADGGMLSAADLAPAQSKRSLTKASAKQRSVTSISTLGWHANKLEAIEYERTHRFNIQQRLQHRIEVARARGDEKLLNLLQHELQQAS